MINISVNYYLENSKRQDDSRDLPLLFSIYISKQNPYNKVFRIVK